MPTATSRDTSAGYESVEEDGDVVATSGLAPLSEVEFMDLLGELCSDFAPRRFALGEVHGDYDDGRVFAWGTAFEDRAVLCSDDGRPFGVFPSAERALARLSRHVNLRLVWVDPGPDPDDEL
jgi:hypothetical protein